MATVAALTLAAALWGAGRGAHAARVEGHFEPGALIGQGLPLISVRPTLGGDVTTWWSPGQHLDLGLESGIAVTSLPYGNNDGEPVLGKRGGYNPSYLNESVTLMPRMMFGSRAFLLARTWVGAFVGSSWLASSELGRFSLIPYPTGSLAIETRFGADGRYGVRAAFSYMRLWVSSGDALMTSTLAFTWGN
jgi:hypothetical protein